MNLKTAFTKTCCIAFATAGSFSLQAQTQKPNVVLILVDNLGYGEIGTYGGGILRGAPTPRIDKLADEGLKLLNYNVEPICTPSRSALLTGRHPIRSGTYKVSTEKPYGLVQWERTLGELLSDKGYATGAFGKWHLGNTQGRLPNDQGFDEWYGIPNSSTESVWPDSVEFDKHAGFYAVVLSGKKGAKTTVVKRYDEKAKHEIDNELTAKAVDFIQRNAKAKKPFFAYVPFTSVHFPTEPSDKFEGKTGNGDWADVLTQLDYNVGQLIDAVEQQGIKDNTIFIFASDNGAEDTYPSRGWNGPWSGSYVTAMEGSIRVPFIVRWPGKIPARSISNEIVHETDIFSTLAKFTQADIPTDRPIDGIDQSAFFFGKQSQSNRTGFPIYVMDNLYAVKYKNWKIHYIWQESMYDAPQKLNLPRAFNLYVNPEERPDEAKNTYFYNSWLGITASQITDKMQESFIKYPNIPLYTPDPYVPNYK